MQITFFPRFGFLLTVTFFILSLVSIPTFAARLGTPIPGDWNKFPVCLDEGPNFALRFDFKPSASKSEKPWNSPGVLDGIQAPEDSFLSFSRPLGPAGPNDHFSVQWRGYWIPREPTVDIRLRADETAMLFINGKPALECDATRGEATTTIELDPRPHKLRLDYSESEGVAHVFLEYRKSGEAWQPLVTTQHEAGKTYPGWKATYFKGASYENPSLERIDPTIAFNWREQGPFGDAEDAPAIQFRWGHENGRFFGELVPNCSGELTISPEHSSVNDIESFQLSGTNTEFMIANGEQTPLLDLMVSRPGECQEAAFKVSLIPGQPFQFWEKDSPVRSGGVVSRKLDSAYDHFEETRPRLGGVLEPWDKSLIPSGRWWTNVLLNSSQIPSTSTHSAVASFVGLWAPDLQATLEPREKSFTDEGKEKTESETNIPPTLVAGLAQMIDAMNHLKPYTSTQLEETPSIGSLDPPRGEATLRNWPLGSATAIITISPAMIRIEVPEGLSMTIDRPARVEELRIGKRGEWNGKLFTRTPGSIEIGPAEKVSVLKWDGKPFLLMKRRGVMGGRLPGSEGRLEMHQLFGDGAATKQPGKPAPD